MKTAEELNALKNEVEALNKKLAELSEEELAQVTGGMFNRDCAIAFRKFNDAEKQIELLK